MLRANIAEKLKVSKFVGSPFSNFGGTSVPPALRGRAHRLTVREVSSAQMDDHVISWPFNLQGERRKSR